MTKLISFTKQEYAFKKHPLSVYILRDLSLYTLVFCVLNLLSSFEVTFNSIGYNLIVLPLFFIVGFLLFASMHEWFHYIGIWITKGKAYLNPMGSLLRLYYYDFEENTNTQNMTMMLSGLLLQWPVMAVYFYLVSYDSHIWIAFNAGLVLSVFLTPFIELYIAYPKYLGKMSFKACYVRHEPYRKRNMFYSLLAALPFMFVYLWVVI